MPHGKTLDMLEFDRMQQWRVTRPRERENRDRSLRGKARRLSRKIQNKESKSE